MIMPSAAATLEAKVKEYGKELDIQLPFFLEKNDQAALVSITYPHRQGHAISYDPDLIVFRNEGTTHFPLLEDDEIHYRLLSELSRLHLGEKIIPTMGRPYTVESETQAELFSIMHKHAVDVWTDDVIYEHWPQVFEEAYDQVGASYLNRLNCPGMHCSMMVMVLYGIAQYFAGKDRHEDLVGNSEDAVGQLRSAYPSLAEFIRPLAEKFASMPKVSYKKGQDRKMYEQSIKEVARMINLNPMPQLKRVNNEFMWCIKE